MIGSKDAQAGRRSSRQMSSHLLPPSLVPRYSNQLHFPRPHGMRARSRPRTVNGNGNGNAICTTSHQVGSKWQHVACCCCWLARAGATCCDWGRVLLWRTHACAALRCQRSFNFAFAATSTSAAAATTTRRSSSRKHLCDTRLKFNPKANGKQ